MRNAKSIWFALVGLLAFVTAVAMGVEHVDFYGVDRSTGFPLVNLQVQSTVFFHLAPMTVAVFFVYFQYDLILISTRISDMTLTDVDLDKAPDVFGWSVLNMGFPVRHFPDRTGDATGKHAMRKAAHVVFAFAVFLAAPAVLLGVWWLTLPARWPVMSGLAAVALIASVLMASIGANVLWNCRAGLSRKVGKSIHSSRIVRLCIFLGICSGAYTVLATSVPWGPFCLAEVNLRGRDLVAMPDGWLPPKIAEKDFESYWCKRAFLPTCAVLTAQQSKAMEQEWDERRKYQIAALRSPDISARNLSGAILRNAFLTGIAFGTSDLSRSDLTHAKLERAEFGSARLIQTDMTRADLYLADFHGLKLDQVTFKSASLYRATFANARLSDVDFQNADLERVNFSRSRVTNGTFDSARLLRAHLKQSLLSGSDHAPLRFDRADMSGSVNQGGALRHADLSQARFDEQTDWRNAVLDGSVRIPDDFRMRMGSPCQWSDKVLDDAAFFALWRGWLGQDPTWSDSDWPAIAPPEWRDVKAKDLGDCAWNVGPMLNPGHAP